MWSNIDGMWSILIVVEPKALRVVESLRVRVRV